MTIEEINTLSINSCLSILRERLGLAEGESADDQALLDEFEAYKAELIQEIEDREAEKSRIEDLKSRFSQLTDSGLIQKQGIQNPAAYFRDEILNNSDKEDAEAKLAQIEISYQSDIDKLNSEAWLQNRQSEYSKIDKLLLEALAEQAEGRPERMEEYLQLREQIKLQFPKPE